MEHGKEKSNDPFIADEQLPVSTYLRKTIASVDGIAWMVTCIASLICIMDVLLSTNIIPLRYIYDREKTIVLLLFSPLIVFLVMVNTRLLPFSRNNISAWFRAALCIFVFLILNF